MTTTIDTKVMHACQCGFSWEHGFSGQHVCDPFYREKISVLEARVKELEALKGDQVPVAEIKFHPSTDKHPCMYWFGKQDRDFPVGTQFFTAPQKDGE